MNSDMYNDKYLNDMHKKNQISQMPYIYIYIANISYIS